MRRPVGEFGLSEGHRGNNDRGKSKRIELPHRLAARMLAADKMAREWLESVIWPVGPICASRKSTRIS